LIAARSLLGCALLLRPSILWAQHHGGHGGASGIPGATNRPTGVDEKDDLKDFHHALAVQATTQQIADFQALVKETDAAKAKLDTFTLEQRKENAASRPTVTVSEIDQFLQRALIDSRKFVDGFSSGQKSGLKETLKKVNKADSDLEVEEKRLDDTVRAENRSDLESARQSLTKSLAAFSEQQLALGREMGVVLAEGSDVTFNLPEVKTPVKVGALTFDVAAGGLLSQTAAQGARRTFKVQVVVDISELRENLTDLLRFQLSGGRACGERLELRQATMTLSEPASVVNLSLHYERWSCMAGAPQEVAEGEGSVDVKLRPTVDKANSLKLVSEFSRIDAGGLMAESLRSGSLGEDLRNKLSQSLLSILRSAVDFQKLLPAVVRQLAEVQSAKFEDTGIGKIAVELNGEMKITDEQASLMASQLNQALFAQGSASQESQPAKGR
jgi:hypothetical protein